MTVSAVPFEFELVPESSTITLISQLLSLYGYDMETEVVLHRPGVYERKEYHLSDIERIDSRFDGKFSVFFLPMEFKFKQFYDSTLSIDRDHFDPVTEEAYKKVLMDHIDKMNNYTAFVFRHKMVYFAIQDYINGTPSSFTHCLPSYLKSVSPLSLFTPEVVESVLAEIFAEFAASKYTVTDTIDANHPFAKMINDKDTRFSNFCKFLAQLITGDITIGAIIRKVIGMYKPSYIASLFVVEMTRSLSAVYDSATLYRIVSDLFQDAWLWHCFPDDEARYDFMEYDNFMDIFPYIGIRLGMNDTLKTAAQRTSPLIIYYFSQGRTFRNIRTTEVVATSLFTRLYALIQKRDIVPVLVMSQTDIDDISAMYKGHCDVLKSGLSFSEFAQTRMLDILLETWKRHGMEPKGFLYANVAMMANVGIIEESFIKKWVQSSTVASGCLDTILLELNCLVLSTMTIGKE